MDLDTNIGARYNRSNHLYSYYIGSFQIAYETYEKINSVTYALENSVPGDRIMSDLRQTDWKRDAWYKVRTRQQSNRFAILYSSVFVFCVSLCCFTYICVKK